MKHFIFPVTGKGWYPLRKTEESKEMHCCLEAAWGCICGQGHMLSSSSPKYLKPYLRNEHSKKNSVSPSCHSLQLFCLFIIDYNLQKDWGRSSLIYLISPQNLVYIRSAINTYWTNEGMERNGGKMYPQVTELVCWKSFLMAYKPDYSSHLAIRVFGKFTKILALGTTKRRQ